MREGGWLSLEAVATSLEASAAAWRMAPRGCLCESWGSGPRGHQMHFCALASLCPPRAASGGCGGSGYDNEGALAGQAAVQTTLSFFLLPEALQSHLAAQTGRLHPSGPKKPTEALSSEPGPLLPISAFRSLWLSWHTTAGVPPLHCLFQNVMRWAQSPTHLLNSLLF